MQIEGLPRQEIADSLGISSAAYAWHLRQGKFGDLPTGQGRRRRPEIQIDDNIETGMIFSCPETEWRERQRQIRDSWPEPELVRRASGRLPNVKDNYSRFKQNNPNIKQNKQPGRKVKWPRTY